GSAGAWPGPSAAPHPGVATLAANLSPSMTRAKALHRPRNRVKSMVHGAAPREDTTAGVRPICGRAPAAGRQGEAGDVRLPRLHAHLREEAERTVHGGEADDPEEVAGEAARGESRAAAPPARPDLAGGDMAGSGCRWAHPVLRGAHEQPGHRPVPVPGGRALAPRAGAA